MFLWESQRLLGRVRRWFFAYLLHQKEVKGITVDSNLPKMAELTQWYWPVTWSMKLTCMSPTSLPSRGLPGKLNRLTLSSLAGSFRSWNPRIPPSCRDLFTLQGHFGEVTFFSSSVSLSRKKSWKLANPAMFPHFQVYNWLIKFRRCSINQHQDINHPSNWWQNQASSAFHLFFSLLKSRGFPWISRKNRCFFLLAQLQTSFFFTAAFRIPRRWTFAITKTSHGDGRW